jgi:regulatory protein YycI of two-component signal transduction system YycFG
MTTALLFILLLLDVGLMAAVFFLNRRQDAHIELVEELTEERRLLAELRTSVQEELENAQGKARETLEKAMKLATEAEQEVKSGGQTIAQDLESVIGQLTGRFEEPLKELTRKQSYLESLLKRVEQEKVVLTKLITRGEKVMKFFDQRVSVEQVLDEIEDKKYADARSLLARGKTPAIVASELGMTESEVRLVAGMGPR